MDGLEDYPMYQLIKEIFGGRDSMYSFSRHFKVTDKKYFNDPDGLATFVDSLDYPRFLYRYPDEEKNFMSAVLFHMSIRGIPMLYYG